MLLGVVSSDYFCFVLVFVDLLNSVGVLGSLFTGGGSSLCCFVIDFGWLIGFVILFYIL